MHIVILLLILIVFILLGGAGAIGGLIYGLFVLAWAAAPWLALMVGVMFVVRLVGGRSRGQTSVSHGSHEGRPERRNERHQASATPDEIAAAIELNRRLDAEYRAKVERARPKSD